MTYVDYAYAVAVSVHEQTGWPLSDAENFIGDVADMMGKYSPRDAASELVGSLGSADVP